MSRVREFVERHIDWPMGLRPALPAVPPFRGYVVARPRNSANIGVLRDASPALHVHDLSSRPGKKFPLLADLIAANPPRPDEWVVIADDDVVFTRGDLSRFIAIAAALAFDVAQPSHDRRGFVNYGLTVSKPFRRARETTFVEIGPVFAVAPRARDRILKTFEDSGMGWGLEQVWRQMGVRFGVIDEVRMLHLARAGSAYNSEQALTEMSELLERWNVVGSQPQRSVRAWAAWNRI